MGCYILRRSRRGSKVEGGPIKELSNDTSETISGRKASKATEAGPRNSEEARSSTVASATRREKEPAGEENATPTHSTNEEGRKSALAEDEFGGRLSETQIEFLRYARQKAKEASDAALPKLAKRFKKLGFAHDALARILQYVRESAPIVIHFDPAKAFGSQSTVLEAFLTDTHYRNQFETHISGGSLGAGRDEGERRLFAGMYHEGGGAIPSERPKYGALNLYQHPQGSNQSYGRCLFELCSDVRKRATFTFGDSLGWTETLGTCEYFAHVLSRFDDANLRSLVAHRSSKADDRVWFLVEAQIHGPVEFRCDIKELRYSSAEPAETCRRLEALAKKNAFTASTF